MLILTRKPGESFVIRHPAGDVVVTHLSSINEEARIGIAAPKDIRILRSEIIDKYPDE
jgi:carbon storage regulator CsrA